jgi:hypothetical protein
LVPIEQLVPDKNPKLCPTVALSHQDGHHSAVALLLKAALIQVSDYRLLGDSGFFFQQSLVEIGSVVSEEKIFLNFIPPFFYFYLGGHLGWKSRLPDTFLEGGQTSDQDGRHSRT